MEHHTATRLDEFEFIVDRSIKQAIATQAAGGADPVAASDRRQDFSRSERSHEQAITQPCPQHQGDEPVRTHFEAGLETEERGSRDRRIGNTNFDLWAAGHRPQNFYMLGSMGLAFPIALGVALAQPERRVFALEGDGSLLMQMGCLSDDRDAGAEKFCMIVMDNGIYQDQPARNRPPQHRCRILSPIAAACGLADSAWAADEEDFERLIDRSLSPPGRR